MLAFMWAGHSYAPDGSQIRTLLLDEFTKLLQSPLDRAPDAVRALSHIGFIGTGQLPTRDLDEGEPLKHVQADMFGLLGADLRQEPIDNQLTGDLFFVNRDVQILRSVMDLDFPVAIREVATVSSVFSGTKTEVGSAQICDFPLRHVRRVVEQGENLIGAEAKFFVSNGWVDELDPCILLDSSFDLRGYVDLGELFAADLLGADGVGLVSGVGFLCG
ncbi:hypothetical protein ACU21_08495 [Actinobaculum suis]|nr:hypothetical protein ACU21_08495 [Actinobaculum suis]